MTDRVAKLRQESLQAVPELSIERALIMTDVYKEHEGKVSLPVLRALAFKAICERRSIIIYDGELIVGEKGHKAKAAPTYPELCCHTPEDFRVIDGREKVFFRVSGQVLEAQEKQVIPFWSGKAMRDKLFANMSHEWLECYEAGIFTEFMEQRAPGHTVCGDIIYKHGFADIKRDIITRLESLDYLCDRDALGKREQLNAMLICCDAVITLGRRYADEAERLAALLPDDGDNNDNAVRKQELLAIARNCRVVPEHKPENFWQALQMYWLVHLSVVSELNTWDAFSPGRLDSHLRLFYERGLESGELTRESAQELLGCLWVKFNNQPAPPKVGITLAESGTYTDFCAINTGGLNADGTDAVSEVSYLILDVIDEMRLVQPSGNIQLSRKNPDKFLRRACDIIKKGWGQPAIFNADAVIAELVRQGKQVEHARQGGTSGCVESGAFGRESYILTGYFNLVKILEITLNNGLDPRTGKQLGLRTGTDFASFDEFFAAYERQAAHFADIKIEGNNIIEALYAEYMPCPFLSCLIEGCTESGRDYNAGGATYNTRYLQGVGIGTLADSLSALKMHVFDKQSVSLPELRDALAHDFAGHKYDDLRRVLREQTPKYGNDDEYADALMLRAFDMYYRLIDGRKGVNGTYNIDMLPTTCHVYFGSVTGATPDGRRAGEAQSEGISPAHGADRQGPTSVLLSAAKMDHLKTGGTLLNQKLTPGLVADDDGISKLMSLVRAYFRMDGHHLQFNVCDAETLRDAQKHPENYTNLIVRVAGYSDYFNDLSAILQNEIISRTEHGGF